jgi:AraC family transcriptional regulator
MELKTHGDRKYHGTTSRLVASAGFANLRIEHRRLEAGEQTPGTCEANEIAFVLSGKTHAIQVANGRDYRNIILPGISCICPVGAFESLSAITSPIECLHIFLPPTLIKQSALADYDIDPSKIELVYSGGLRDPLLYQIAMAFHDTMGRGAEPTDSLFLDGMQASLAAHLLRYYTIDRWPPSKRSSPALDHHRMKRVLDYIEANFAQNISLQDLSREAYLSEFHFSRLFREAIGVSPHRYLTDRRVEAAKHELEFSRSELVEIALEAGFGSQANFTRTFRKATGLTPGQYRALHRGEDAG